jgi:hypothetical protein
MEAHSSPAPTSGPAQGPQPAAQAQPSQSQQPHTSGPPAQQAQTQSSQPQNSQQSQQPQQGQQAANQNPQQQQRLSNAQATQQQAATAAFMRQQQQQAQNSMSGGGKTLLRVFNFADRLGAFRADQQPNDMNHWRKLISQHFMDEGVFRMTLKSRTDKSSKIFEVNASSLPRFFYTQYESDVDQIQLLLDGAIEKTISDTHQFVQAERARMLFWFRDGTQV